MERLLPIEKLCLQLVALPAALLLSACSLDASIVNTAAPSVAPVLSLNRTDPDFLSGEVVTTSNGTTIRAVFGEIAEKKVLSSGHEIEGVVQ